MSRRLPDKHSGGLASKLMLIFLLMPRGLALGSFTLFVPYTDATTSHVMNSLKEKLSILSEMIAFAKIGDTIKEPEYNFLLGVAAHLGVDRETFDSLFETETEHIVPKSQADRILQFHRLVLLMNVDQVQDEIEVSRLHNIGLGMGLPPSAIEQVLTIMHQYPNKVIPPAVLIDIFKAHYN